MLASLCATNPLHAVGATVKVVAAQKAEAAAEGEDALLEKYLETGELSGDELLRGLKDVVMNGSFIPVFVAAAGHEKGVGPLLDAMGTDVIGVNCCDAGQVDAALEGLGGARPGVVYPNSGEEWDAAARSWSGSRSAIAAGAPGWEAGGARLVGGCCRVGPGQIAEIAAAVAALTAEPAPASPPARSVGPNRLEG